MTFSSLLLLVHFFLFLSSFFLLTFSSLLKIKLFSLFYWHNWFSNNESSVKGNEITFMCYFLLLALYLYACILLFSLLLKLPKLITIQGNVARQFWKCSSQLINKVIDLKPYWKKLSDWKIVGHHTIEVFFLFSLSKLTIFGMCYSATLLFCDIFLCVTHLHSIK